MVWKTDLILVNRYSRPGSKVKKRKKGVLHYTANPGATAKNHRNYFNNLNDRFASAHIFVDRMEARMIIPLDEVAYHVNDGSYRGVPALRPNGNLLTIGVEMCLEKDGSIHSRTLRRTEDIFVELCKLFKWNPLNDIVRHYDVTRKDCPALSLMSTVQFQAFKQRVAKKLKDRKYYSVTPPIESKRKTTKQYKGKSIVDYLKSEGINSSYSNRKKLAKKVGIKAYIGTSNQNIELLKRLQVKKTKQSVQTYKFVNTTSIVDFLKTNGVNSSMSNRKRLAKEKGIKNYKGTAAQNQKLLRLLNKK